jgi:hypothetical protein
MKRLLLSLLTGLVLVGCVAPIEESKEVNTPSEEAVGVPSDYYVKDKGAGYDCLPQLVELKLPNGNTKMVLIPVLCDENPYLDKGDPSPDVTSPEDEVTDSDPTKLMKNNVEPVSPMI